MDLHSNSEVTYITEYRMRVLRPEHSAGSLLIHLGLLSPIFLQFAHILYRDLLLDDFILVLTYDRPYSIYSIMIYIPKKLDAPVYDQQTRKEMNQDTWVLQVQKFSLS